MCFVVVLLGRPLRQTATPLEHGCPRGLDADTMALLLKGQDPKESATPEKRITTPSLHCSQVDFDEIM